MSIADKLVTIAENEQKVYDAGYEKGKAENEGKDNSALPIEVLTESEMNALLTSGEVGGVYKYMGETTDTYEKDALYLLEQEETDELAGTWVFKDSLNGSIDSTVNFTSDNSHWTRMSYDGTFLYYYNATNPYGFPVYEEFWRSDKTINITSKLAEVTNGDTLLTWLKNNATKQEETESLISFTLGGTSYQAEQGMTWAEWVESDYNTNAIVVTGSNIHLDSTAVLETDTIIANAEYGLYSGGGIN